MEINAELCDEIYEVEKIIARKIYKSKKYYLIKWLYFPINESTWEPKSNLTNINYMMNKFEAEYPSSIDQYMYDIYCEEYKKKIKFECFSQSELKDIYYEKLKKHLHINNKEKNDNNDLMIEISSNKTQSDDNISNLDENEEKKFFHRLIIPEIN